MSKIDVLLATQQKAFYADLAKEEGQKSMIFDPMQLTLGSGVGYTSTPNLKISYDLLKMVSHRFPVSAIINTRVDQVASFAEAQSDIYSTGFVIRPTKPSNTKELTDTQKREIDILTNFVLECGFNDSYYDGDDFDSFIRKITRDSLVYDQCTFEIVWNNFGWDSKKGKPHRFLATDGSLYRHTSLIENIYDNQSEYPAYALMYNGGVWSYFYKPELCFGVRNVNTDIYRNGYGCSELEDMVIEIESFLNAIAYNKNYFKNGSLPKSIIKLGGSLTLSKIEEFRIYWDAMMKGVNNAWKTPIISADNFDLIDAHKTNKDMEFNSWLEFLLKVVCAMYKIDPSEIGFPMSGASDAKPMFEGNNEARLKYSKDKGLYPLLKFIQNKINKYVIHPISQDYTFYFVGLDGVTREQEIEMDSKLISTYKTINEVRKERGLEPIKGGDIIANQQFMQSYMAMQQGAPQSNEAVTDDSQMGDWTLPEEEKQTEENPFEKAINFEVQKQFYLKP
jgi:hypothetical protein